MDLWEGAKRLARPPLPGWPRDNASWNHLRTAACPKRPLSLSAPVSVFDPNAFSRQSHDNLWNGERSARGRCSAPDYPFEGITTRAFQGADRYDEHVDSLRSTIPDLNLQVDDVYWMGDETDGHLISTRWSADATHTGGDLCREPTGQKVQILGITQQRVKNGTVEQEWQLFNELGLMMQIARARL